MKHRMPWLSAQEVDLPVLVLQKVFLEQVQMLIVNETVDEIAWMKFTMN